MTRSLDKRIQVQRLERCTKITRFVIYADHVEIDKVMSELDVSNLDMFDLVTWLRSTYSIANNLKEWKPLYDRVREIHKANPRLDRILVGLDKPYEN